MWWGYGYGRRRGRGYRWRFWATGIPGWMAFGYSPGWIGVTPTGLPPFAQWLMSTGRMNEFMQYLRNTFPSYPYRRPYPIQASQQTTQQMYPTIPPPTLTPEEELRYLEEQKQFLEQQLQELKRRLNERKKQ